MITDIEQVLRYARADSSVKPKAEAITEDIEKRFPCRFFWQVCDLEKEDGRLYVEPVHMELEGSLAASMLKECDQVIFIAATLGAEFDRHLKKVSLLNMTDGVLADAAGSAWIEASLDEMEKKLAKRFADHYMTDRFSCGYGDLPLSLQSEIGEKFRLASRLGIQVEPSCMMNPTKSVTAFIGLSKKPQPAKIKGCKFCVMQGQCAYRKKGEFCHEF